MKKLSLVRVAILTSIVMIPVVVFAQTVTDVARGIGIFAGLIDGFTQTVVKSLATLLLSAALLAFFYGIIEYIWARRKGDAKGVEDGNKFITWSLVALFVMFSVYGIIKLGQGFLFGTNDVTTIQIPNFTFKPGTAASVQVGQPGGTATPGLGGGTAGSTKKPNAYSCTYDSECQSGFCDPVDDTCTNPSQASLRANGFSCTASPQCSSGFCDPADNTCSAVGSGGAGLGEGVGCADTAQCATGLTCSGSNASNRTCVSVSASSCQGNTGGVTCGCNDDCNGGFFCESGSCVAPGN